jgi:hypothetical protein
MSANPDSAATDDHSAERAPVITDPTGELARLLQDRHADGEALLEQSSELADGAALRGWMRAAEGWRRSTSRLLARRFNREVNEEFAHAVGRTGATRGRAGGLAHEQRALNNGVELLQALHSTQFGRQFGSRSRGPDAARSAAGR